MCAVCLLYVVYACEHGGGCICRDSKTLEFFYHFLLIVVLNLKFIYACPRWKVGFSKLHTLNTMLVLKVYFVSRVILSIVFYSFNSVTQVYLHVKCLSVCSVSFSSCYAWMCIHIYLITFLFYLFCVYIHMHAYMCVGTSVGDRGQLVEVIFSFCTLGPGDGTQVARLGSECLCWLSHLCSTCPVIF